MAKAKLTSVFMTERASKDLEYWSRSGNAKKIERINALINSALLDPLSGIGVPEQLRFKDETTFSLISNSVSANTHYSNAALVA